MTETIINDPDWWPHRYDPARDQIHFIPANRNDHRSAVFLTDEYLKGARSPRAIDRSLAVSGNKNHAPIHFIFHSGYCCSTLLARAFDIPGVSMGFKEPVILNDIVGMRARNGGDESIEDILSDTLALLAHPFEDGETLIVKPSCLINVIAQDMLSSRPQSKALLLHAPLQDFLGSIARKGLWGRLWVRELMSKQLRDGMINLGLEGDDYLRLTDLQAAAVSWLTQQSLFASMLETLPNERLISLDSSTLMASPEANMQRLCQHFGLSVDSEDLKTIVTGPVFMSHSKTKTQFDSRARDADREAGLKLHAEEIEKVSTWAKIVAENAGIPLTLSE